MWKNAAALLAATTVAACGVGAPEGSAVLDEAGRRLGTREVQSIRYTGTGSTYAFGQNPSPDAPLPRFEVVSYTALIDYDTPGMQVDLVRRQAEHPPRGGGQQPVIGDQRQIQVVSGSHAWNVAGDNVVPAPGATTDRLAQIVLTPQGFVRAARAANASVEREARDGREVSVVSFTHGEQRMRGVIDSDQLVARTETWVDNPVLGDVLIETTFDDYRDFSGIQFPTQIVQRQAGHPVLELTVSEVQLNPRVDLQVPDAVAQAPAQEVRVDTEEVADGVWYLTGGSHHSVAVEFSDHVVVIEGPQNEARALAVIEEVRNTIPEKPIRYVVNTHHHFDHSGGLPAFAAEDITIVTHEINRDFYERAFAAPRTINPDRLARSGRSAMFQTVTDKHVLADDRRRVELHHIQGNAHNDGMLMAYLPEERILIQADAYTPGPPDAPPPARPNPFSVNLYENIGRLGLDVDRILPLHGRMVTIADLRQAIGRQAVPTE